MAAAVLTSVTFDLAPAWLASRAYVGNALQENSRSATSGRVQQRLKYALIVGQLALALVLVSAALSFGIGVKQALKHDLGWQMGGLVGGIVELPGERYKGDENKFEFTRALKAKLEHLPGVSQVAISSQAPVFGYGDTVNFIVEGYAPIPKGQEPLALSSAIDADFLPILGVPLKAGNYFPKNIKAGDPAVVIINESMARQYWPGQNAIGKRLRFVDKETWCEIIGVVGDVRMSAGFGKPASRLQIYRALEQAPSGNGIYSFTLKGQKTGSGLGAWGWLVGPDPDVFRRRASIKA